MLRFLALLAPALLAGAAAAVAAPPVRTVYVFGDSTADVGNNNYLPGAGAARANFPHNGVDFPTGRATGRFSNGYNGIDFLARHLGFRRSPPPFLSQNFSQGIPRGWKGANFASAGSGILDSTGSTITLRNQIQHFATVKSNLTAVRASADDALQNSIFLVSTGGNDIFAFFTQNRSPTDADRQQFISTLVSAYRDHMKNLYSLGARKLGLIDVPPIGCCPYPRSLHPAGACLEVLNELASQFNEATKSMMSRLSTELGAGFNYSIGSSNAVVSSIIKNPGKLGFKETGAACCGGGKLNGQSGCTPNATLCAERRHFVFWDMLHPTHATAKLAAAAIYSGSGRFASPINLRQLAAAGGGDY